MRYLLMIITLIFISGCNNDVCPLNKAKSDYACRDSGGVYRNGTWAIKVICNDGSYHNLPEVILDKNYWVKEENENNSDR